MEMKPALIGVCLCALLHVLSAAVIKSDGDHQKLLVKQRYGHLQVEIDEWKRLGKPTVAAFPSGPDGGTELGLLVDAPLTASIFTPDYDNNVFFYLFTRDNPNGTEVAPNAKSFSVAGWDNSKPTKIAIHGFTNNIGSPMFTTLVPSLLDNQDCNVVGVDWGQLCKSPFYIEARNHVEGVGKVVAKLVDGLVQDGGLKLDELHVMGHSLGAHVAGCTGKHVKTGKINRVTAPSYSNSTDDGTIETLSKEVVIQLFTRPATNKSEILSVVEPELLQNSNFNPLVPTKIITHGWLSGQNRTAGAGGPILKDAILEKSAYNVILVDWSRADSINYIASRVQLKALGELLGALVNQLVDVGGMDTNDLHLIGHSLGAHIMGFAGRSANLGDKGRITAMDPAGPLFWNNPEYRLDKMDAGFVDVIHTCAGYLGYRDPIGHADFYPNGGTWVQPGCGLDFGACSHCRSYSLLLESIESPDAFVGTKCDSFANFEAGECAGNGTAIMGFGIDRRVRGSFYLETNAEAPYSKTAGMAASGRLQLTENFEKC